MKRKWILGITALVAVVTFVVIFQGIPSWKDKSSAEAPESQSYYTCPMHPSVRSDHPGACPVCGMALVKKQGRSSADTTHHHPDDGTSANLESVRLSPAQRIIANVSVTMAHRQAMNIDLQAVGVVSYAEPNYRHISMRFPGRLEKLYLSYTGQTVLKGDPVADVYSPEAISAQQEFLLSLDSYEQSNRGMDNAEGTQGEQTFAASSAQMMEQSRNKLLQWGFTDAQLVRLKKTRKPDYVVTIYSQVSGTVVKKSVDPQHYVATGEDMFDVADLSTVWVYLDVYEKDIRHISVGQSALITSEAYPAERFEGRVVFIDPVLDPETRTIRVRVELPNLHGKLKPNMFVRGMIAVPELNAIVVPSSALLSTGRKTVVWVEVKESVFEPRDVIIGPTSGALTVVLEGLEEGETVAETGGFLLDSESALQTQDAPGDKHAGHAKKGGQ